MAANESTATPTATEAIAAAKRTRVAKVIPSATEGLTSGSPAYAKAILKDLFYALPKTAQVRFFDLIGTAGATIDALVKEAEVDAKESL